MRLGWMVAFGLACMVATAEPARVIENVDLYNEPTRFAGWPANNGIWTWGDEIVVGFTLGYYKDSGGGHPIDRDRPSFPMQARSLDGGKTWAIETPSHQDELGNEPEPVALEESIDFSHPDFAMKFRMEHSNSGFSRFYYSYDRCKTWEGPFKLPEFGRSGIFARTDYIVNGKHDMHAFFTAAEDEGGEGWPFAARTQDGGKTWDFLGWIGEQPEPAGYSIMPSTVRLNDNALLSMIRMRSRVDGQSAWWVEPYVSPDNGKSWYLMKEPYIDNAGNPAHMIRLEDGRIVVTYGWRNAPYGIRARISTDNGQTFGDEIILRDDGDNWDLGYPRTVQRADGNIVTAYYFNDSTQVERYIAVTIWDPGTGEGTE